MMRKRIEDDDRGAQAKKTVHGQAGIEDGKHLVYPWSKYYSKGEES